MRLQIWKKISGTEAKFSAAVVSGPHPSISRYFQRPVTIVNLNASYFPLCLKEIFNKP